MPLVFVLLPLSSLYRQLGLDSSYIPPTMKVTEHIRRKLFDRLLPLRALRQNIQRIEADMTDLKYCTPGYSFDEISRLEQQLQAFEDDLKGYLSAFLVHSRSGQIDGDLQYGAQFLQEITAHVSKVLNKVQNRTKLIKSLSEHNVVYLGKSDLSDILIEQSPDCNVYVLYYYQEFKEKLTHIWPVAWNYFTSLDNSNNFPKDAEPNVLVFADCDMKDHQVEQKKLAVAHFMAGKEVSSTLLKSVLDEASQSWAKSGEVEALAKPVQRCRVEIKCPKSVDP